MSKLIVYMGDNPQCIEGFSDSCSRSCQGALHLRKGKPVTVTDDEYDFIKKARSDVASKIRVVADKPDAPKAVAEQAAVAPEALKPAEPAKVVEVAAVQASEKPAEVSTEAKADEAYSRKGKPLGKTV